VEDWSRLAGLICFFLFFLLLMAMPAHSTPQDFGQDVEAGKPPLGALAGPGFGLGGASLQACALPGLFFAHIFDQTFANMRSFI
jgi:hypothetical protein